MGVLDRIGNLLTGFLRYDVFHATVLLAMTAMLVVALALIVVLYALWKRGGG
jgi:hypothetical protein